MASTMPTFSTLTFKFILTFLLLTFLIAAQQATARHLPEGKPSPRLELAASKPPGSIYYKPTMFRSLPSFQRRPLLPPRLIPALPSFPSGRPTLPTIPSLPTGPNVPGIPVGTPPSVPSTPPPPYDLRSSENFSEKNEDDKKASDFPQP